MPGAAYTDAEIATFRRLASGEARNVDHLVEMWREHTGRKVSRGAVDSILKRIGVTAHDVVRAHGAAQGGRPIPVAPPPPPPPAPEWPPPGYEPRASRPAKSAKADVVRSIVIADAHHKYAQRKAWECALGIIRDVKPHRVVLNGDILEMEALSRHPKSKPDLTRLSEEFYAGNLALDEIQNAAQGAETYYIEGNHENRASRFAAEFGELDGMLSVPVSLYITPKANYHRETVQLRGVHWVPLSMQPFTIGAAAYLHGVFESLYHAAMTAQHVGPKCNARVLVTGHMHGWQSFASPSGFVAYSCPWLGDETAHVFRAYVKGRPRPWHLGVLHVEECGEDVTVTPIFIRNGRALFGGRVFSREAA